MNKAILMGRLTRDPEYNKGKGDRAIGKARFTLAVDRRYAAQNGDRLADFVDCVAWNKTADMVEKWIRKGMKIVVEGSIRTSNYEAQDGSKRHVTEVEVDHIEFCESRKNEAQSNDGYTEVDDDQLPF